MTKSSGKGWHGPREKGSPSPPFKGERKKLTKKGREIRSKAKNKPSTMLLSLVRKNISNQLNRIREQGDIFNTTGYEKSSDILNTLAISLVGALKDTGVTVNVKDIESIFKDATDTMIEQTMESNARQFTNHDVWHIGGNLDYMKQMFDELQRSGKSLSNEDKLIGVVSNLYHDLGYLHPDTKGTFNTDVHPSNGADMFKKRYI